MKFILVLQICSAVLNTCDSPKKAGIHFDSIKECKLQSQSILNSIYKEIEIDTPVILYSCMEDKGDDV
jgi:hypothetical protein